MAYCSGNRKKFHPSYNCGRWICPHIPAARLFFQDLFLFSSCSVFLAKGKVRETAAVTQRLTTKEKTMCFSRCINSAFRVSFYVSPYVVAVAGTPVVRLVERWFRIKMTSRWIGYDDVGSRQKCRIDLLFCTCMVLISLRVSCDYYCWIYRDAGTLFHYKWSAM